ncbi:hypothetical protein D3C84_1210590 [compost metagenome]
MAVNAVEHEHYNRQENKGHPDTGELRNNEDQGNGKGSQHPYGVHGKFILPAFRLGLVPVYHHAKLG